jgi:hypothetical protein
MTKSSKFVMRKGNEFYFVPYKGTKKQKKRRQQSLLNTSFENFSPPVATYRYISN